ncbi:MAG: hypothetical protein Q7U38_14100 [Methylobacter sp.]|nr:hypothetical protein [Methylobacter sp.]MDZ4201763.1 hypothetical protein [Gallionella sp.]MDP2099915.1 hypothetical protein [Methylobacter sp.]MDP2427773.1 hypothetical protein [Methylobacter sp.]MDP3054153.1 hypothetical protein [Methylobacter sp.]
MMREETVPTNPTHVFIAVARTEEYGDVILTDYMSATRCAVEDKIIDVARQEGFKGTIEERLKELNWEIGEFELTRV